MAVDGIAASGDVGEVRYDLVLGLWLSTRRVYKDLKSLSKAATPFSPDFLAERTIAAARFIAPGPEVRRGHVSRPDLRAGDCYRVEAASSELLRHLPFFLMLTEPLNERGAKF